VREQLLKERQKLYALREAREEQSDGAWIAWLETQLAYARTDGPLKRMRDALDAAWKRNQTIAFLATDLTRIHKEARNLRSRLASALHDNKLLREKLREMSIKLNAAIAAKPKVA